MNKYERERILKDFSKRLDVLSYMRKIESYQIESLEKFIRSSPLDVIKELYESIPKKKRKKVVEEEEIRKSVLEYAKNWPEEMKKRADKLIGEAPKPPPAPSSPELRR